MRPPMIHTAYKISTTSNAYGDLIAGANTELACHFRHITEIVTEADEQIQSDAMAWFMPDSGIGKKDLIEFDDEVFMVERVIIARKLRDSAVQFIKCYLTKYGGIS